MSNSLYTINEEILSCIDLTTGEIIDTDKFDSLQIEKNDKLENVALWYKNLLAEASAFKAEKDVFADKQKRAESKADSLKKYLDTALHGNKFGTVKVDITYRKSSSVEVDDVELLPADYKKSVTTITADKVGIAKALKVGEEVTGAKLVENNNIQIK
jgi:hypothetical protein